MSKGVECLLCYKLQWVTDAKPDCNQVTQPISFANVQSLPVHCVSTICGQVCLLTPLIIICGKELYSERTNHSNIWRVTCATYEEYNYWGPKPATLNEDAHTRLQLAAEYFYTLDSAIMGRPFPLGKNEYSHKEAYLQLELCQYFSLNENLFLMVWKLKKCGLERHKK